MIRKDYNKMILRRIESSFDRIMPIGTFIAWASAIAIYYSEVPRRFMLFNIVAGTIFLLFASNKKSMNVQQKLYMTIIIAFFIGILAFMDGGFASSGLQLLMIGNVMAVMFLSKRKSAIIALLSTITFIALYIFALNFPSERLNEVHIMLWLVKFLVFTLYLFILHTVVYSIRDYLLESIRELEDSVETTYSLAYYDALTGIPNQNKFKKDLGQLVDGETIGYLVILNVRNLNLINSIYNDAYGDQVLVNIARFMEKVKAPKELLARISGNEFALWINCDNFVTFRQRMLMLKDQFFEQFHIPNMTKTLDFNASYIRHGRGDAIEDTYHKAKLALTYAKTQGEPKIIAYDKALENVLREDELLKERMMQAINDYTFQVHYQGKYDIESKQLVGVEALARFDDMYGSVSPMVFIPLLEEMNYAVVFSERMIRQVFADYRLLCQKYGQQLTISINISPSHLKSDRFVHYVRHEIIQHDVMPSNVIFEITEEVMIDNVDLVKKRIQECRQLGFSISLDDFGSGYSSLSYLTVFPFDEVKIDKSFIDQIKGNNRVDKMIEMIVDLSEHYGLNIVAEGVENKEQFDKLATIGCHEVQGYYFSRPQPLK